MKYFIIVILLLLFILTGCTSDFKEHYINIPVQSKVSGDWDSQYSVISGNKAYECTKEEWAIMQIGHTYEISAAGDIDGTDDIIIDNIIKQIN